MFAAYETLTKAQLADAANAQTLATSQARLGTASAWLDYLMLCGPNGYASKD